MQEHLSEFDRLRGLAIVGIIIIHSTVHCIDSVHTDIFNNLLLIFLNQISRFGVPAFLVISGFFMTKQEILGKKTTQQIVFTRIKRIAPPYVVWSCLYYILFIITGEAYATDQSLAIIFLEKLITGTVTWHLFFVLMILQCYILCLLGVGRKGNISRLHAFSCVTLNLLFIVISYTAEFKNTFESPLISAGLTYFQAFSRSLFPMYISFFLFGRWLGANYDSVSTTIEKYSTVMAIGATVAFLFALSEFLLLRRWTNGSVKIPQDWNVTTNIFAFLLILTLIPRLKVINRGDINSGLMWLARFSFALYLLHEPLLRYITNAFYNYASYLTRSQFILQPILIISGIFVTFALYKCIATVLPKPFRHYFFG